MYDLVAKRSYPSAYLRCRRASLSSEVYESIAQNPQRLFDDEPVQECGQLEAKSTPHAPRR
jgi:hypothetical protein